MIDIHCPTNSLRDLTGIAEDDGPMSLVRKYRRQLLVMVGLQMP